MSTIHTIFGTGPLGRSVMHALRKRDDVRVRMVSRSGNRAGIPDDVEVVRGDVTNPAIVTQLTTDAQVVYQCAQPEYTEWPQQFPPIITGIIEGVAATEAKLIVGDNLYMYGDTDGGVVHSQLPYHPHGHKTRTRAELAEQLLAAHQSGKVPVAIARGSDFYGEGVRGSLMGERVFGFMVEGKAASVFGNIDLPHTQTYIGDFGEAMAILGQREDALGRAWHVPNAEPTITMREFIHRIAAIIGVEPQIDAMPKIMFEVVSLFHPVLREYREMRYELEKPYIVDSSDFIKTFGDISTPIDEGIRKTVAWYQQQMDTVPR